MRAVCACSLAVALAASSIARAKPAEPDAHADEAFDFMNLLRDLGLHDQDDEAWNAYGQATTILHHKFPFHAAYTNVNGSNHSLRPDGEWSYTFTATVFFGFHLWRGGELYIVPEVIGQIPLSDLTGLGGAIQNAELQKSGGATPKPYLSRIYLRQTFALGGDLRAATSEPMQLGKVQASRRVVATLGSFSVLDFLDKNSFSGDLRRQLMNMGFLTYGAYDFAADSRGYTYGLVGELFWDDWSVRAGHIAEPYLPNQLPLDLGGFLRFDTYGDQVELAHAHRVAGHPGVVRVLGYRNRVKTGRFGDAIAVFNADPTLNAAGCADAGLYNYGSTNAFAPDLCYVRRPNTKTGVGVNVEQELTAHVGMFLRAMYSDGETEVYAFNPPDRSLAIGALVKGAAWHRRWDLAGVGYGASGISASHAQYLKMGGVDNFIGDGNLKPATEHVVEAFYSYAVASWLWLAADFQEVWHPAFNADRGPVTIVGGRLHAEF